MRAIWYWRLAQALASVLALGSCGGGGSTSAAPSSGTSLLATLPDDSARAVQLFPAAGTRSAWVVWRRWPDGAILVYERDAQGVPRRRDFTEGAQTMALRILESSGALYLFGYDVERNMPSGRDPNVVREGVDVYRFMSGVAAAPVRVARDLPLGGLDNLIHARILGDEIAACAVDRCLSVRPGSAPTAWPDAALTGREIVDLRFEGDEAWALLRSKTDRMTGDALPGEPNYLFARMSATGSSAQALPDECVPYALRVGTSGPDWSCATSSIELASVLREDLARMPHGGLMEFGSSNLEGRIAWSAVYYLRGLLHLGAQYLPHLAAAGDWSATQARVDEELQLVAQIGASDAMGYVSRRYSRDRAPLLFAVHLGRIAHLLHGAEQAGRSTSTTQAALKVLRAEIDALQMTVETPQQQAQAGRLYDTLGLRRGSAFWADGANVAYNFLSAAALGVLATDVPTQADVQRATTLLLPLQTLENPGGADRWHYWWGLGYTGWTAMDNVSSNTPSYPGQTNWAHITYRSIDAMALVRLHSLAAAAVPRATVDHIASLVASGLLLPFVNEELARIGAAATLAPSVARRYARSAAPWELQAQVWALESLAPR